MDQKKKEVKILLQDMKNMFGKNKSSSDSSIGEGLKIMTPNQLLTRLPILLAQKKAGNNSQKLNNETRQIIYSLHSSKNMSKAVCNHLMNSI